MRKNKVQIKVFKTSMKNLVNFFLKNFSEKEEESVQLRAVFGCPTSKLWRCPTYRGWT